MFYKIILISLLLSGCAQRTASEFVPFTPENHSSRFTYLGDLVTCRGYAKDYLSGRGSIDISQVAQEGLQGGLKQAPTAVLTPYAPALGALGNASTEIVSELGLDSQEARKIISWCMHDKGLQNGYSVFDPNL